MSADLPVTLEESVVLHALANVLIKEPGILDHVHATRALAEAKVLTVTEIQYLADLLELCPAHLVDAAICADDNVLACADLRMGLATLPDDFDFAAAAS